MGKKASFHNFMTLKVLLNVRIQYNVRIASGLRELFGKTHVIAMLQLRRNGSDS